jgi:hypothetical protein
MVLGSVAAWTRAIGSATRGHPSAGGNVWTSTDRIGMPDIPLNPTRDVTVSHMFGERATCREGSVTSATSAETAISIER